MGTTNRSTETVYDFIVVGAGASGSVVASRLARTNLKPSVLLLEAGGDNNAASNVSAAERFELAFSPHSPLNWKYKTCAQQHLAGQEIDYSRGKGLGGSTAINFCGWVVGPRDDYDEWARLVHDESFGWRNAKRCLDRIVNLHPEIPDKGLKRYVEARTNDHGTSGPLHLTYGESWLLDVGDVFTAATQSGLPTNKDVNSGHPLGMGMGSVCIYQGQRLTAASAYLGDTPPNLKILTNAAVASILFEEKTAIGVRTVDGSIFYARREVIVSGGALNTPQILMLSGVGPREELEKHGVPVVHELPMVGKKLQDHCFSCVGITMKRDSDAPADRKNQSPSPMGWFKSPSILSSPEFNDLPRRLQQFLNRQTVPSFEITTHTPPSLMAYHPSPDVTFLGAMCLIMNPQSCGTVSLRSSDPSAPPLIDPKFLTHTYDRRVLIDGIRQTMQILAAPVYAARTLEALGPKDDSDEAIWDHIRNNIGSSWHMSSTARMGVSSESACVDSDFRVFGLKGLRVSDLSVCPFVPNNHTQSTAYVIGEMAAEKLIVEYGLQSKTPQNAARI